MSSPQRMIQSEALLRELLEAAIAAAQPAQAVLPHLPAAAARADDRAGRRQGRRGDGPGGRAPHGRARSRGWW